MSTCHFTPIFVCNKMYFYWTSFHRTNSSGYSILKCMICYPIACHATPERTGVEFWSRTLHILWIIHKDSHTTRLDVIHFSCRRAPTNIAPMPFNRLLYRVSQTDLRVIETRTCYLLCTLSFYHSYWYEYLNVVIIIHRILTIIFWLNSHTFDQIWFS